MFSVNWWCFQLNQVRIRRRMDEANIKKNKKHKFQMLIFFLRMHKGESPVNCRYYEPIVHSDWSPNKCSISIKNETWVKSCQSRIQWIIFNKNKAMNAQTDTHTSHHEQPNQRRKFLFIQKYNQKLCILIKISPVRCVILNEKKFNEVNGVFFFTPCVYYLIEFSRGFLFIALKGQ